MSTSGKFYGWKLLAALWLIMSINVAFPFFGGAVINTWMAADFHLDRRMLGMPFTLFLLMTGLPGPLIAIFVNRVGIRLTLMAGSLLVLVGSLCMALLVHNGLQAVLVFGLVVGMGTAAGGPVASQTGAARWFVRRRALALSIVMSAPGFGGFIATPLLNGVITAAGGDWRMGWWLIAGLACISFTAALLVVRDTPSMVGQTPDGDPPGGAGASGNAVRAGPQIFRTRHDWTLREVLRTPVMWLLLVCGIGFSSCFFLFLAHGVIHLQDLGHTPAAAARSLSLVTIFTLVGNFLIGFLGDRIEPRRLLVGTILLCSLSMLLVVRADLPWKLYPYAMCLGAGFGGSTLCMMTIVSNFFGSRVYASVVGLVLAVQTTASSTLPVLAGSLFDRTGTYAPVFYGLAAWSLCCAVLLLFVRAPRQAADAGA